MELLTVKELALIGGTYSGSNGAFSRLHLILTGCKSAEKFGTKWHTCRESFATDCSNGKVWTMPENGFLFYHQGKTTEDIAEFLGKFESLLEIGRRKPLLRSTIQKINSGGIWQKQYDDQTTWITPGPFWLQQTMRFSLLTMLCRCANNGYHHGDGDFFAALFLSYNLAQGCKASISRFLDGYTWYKGKNDGMTQGWYNTFQPLETNGAAMDAWKALVRPQPKKPKPPAPSEDAILKNDPSSVVTAQGSTPDRMFEARR